MDLRDNFIQAQLVIQFAVSGKFVRRGDDHLLAASLCKTPTVLARCVNFKTSV